MKGPTPRRLHDYLCRCLGLKWYLQDPGDGRTSPQIPASGLVWALVVGKVMRVASFYGLEGPVRQAGGRLGDGTSAGRSRQCRCRLCRPLGGMHGHWFSAISVVGAGLDLPFDAKHYAPGHGELTASKRLLKRAIGLLGRRFAT